MTTPGPQPLGLPNDPVVYHPNPTLSGTVGSGGYGTSIIGQSATWRDDGKVLYAYTEEHKSSSSSETYGWRVVIATCDSPAKFVTQDTSVTELTWVQRFSGLGLLTSGRPGVPTLTRRPNDSTIYLTLTWRVDVKGLPDTPVTPEWNCSGSPPNRGAVLLTSDDDGATWDYVTTIESNHYYRHVDPAYTSEIHFVTDTRWVVTLQYRENFFGFPMVVATYVSTDSGASWGQASFHNTGYGNPTVRLGRLHAQWGEYLYGYHETGSSVPGAINWWLYTLNADGSGAHGVDPNGTGTYAEYETTINTFAGNWANYPGGPRKPQINIVNVGEKLRYYVMADDYGIEVWETSYEQPQFVSFDLIYASYELSALSGNNWTGGIIQPIGGGWAAWLGLDVVIGVPWDLYTVQAIGFSGHPMTPLLGGGVSFAVQAIGTSSQPMTPGVGGEFRSVQAIGTSAQPFTP